MRQCPARGGAPSPSARTADASHPGSPRRLETAPTLPLGTTSEFGVLSDTTGVRVELSYDSGARWYVEWVDGPTVDQMRDRVTAALASPRYTDLRDRQLSYHRGTTPRAWAGRAISENDTGISDHSFAAARNHGCRPKPMASAAPRTVQV